MYKNEIERDFAELFGFSTSEEDTSTTETSTEENVEETATEETSTGTEETGDEVGGEENDGSEAQNNTADNSKSKANFAFAELRNKNKQYTNFIKDLGKAIGLDDSTPLDEVQSKVQELILNKQAKDQNIPVSLLQEMQELRNMVNENKQIKLENEVTSAFTNLATKYKLTSEQLVDFANHLEANNKNPLNGVVVDIEAEYLKIHMQDIVDAAVQSALKSEQDRKDKVDKQASSSIPPKTGETGNDESKINTVADLDKYFGSLNL